MSFRLAVEGTPGEERNVTAKDGVAWVQLNSGRRGGPAQFIASSGEVHVRRIVQQVAADPCSIRMTAMRAPDGNILVETAPIQDCSGNAVPDGTIVTFASSRMPLDAARWTLASSAVLPEPNCPLRLLLRFPWPPA